jgi:hypothetical protein
MPDGMRILQGLKHLINARTLRYAVFQLMGYAFWQLAAARPDLMELHNDDTGSEVTRAVGETHLGMLLLLAQADCDRAAALAAIYRDMAERGGLFPKQLTTCSPRCVVAADLPQLLWCAMADHDKLLHAVFEAGTGDMIKETVRRGIVWNTDHIATAVTHANLRALDAAQHLVPSTAKTALHIARTAVKDAHKRSVVMAWCKAAVKEKSG